jgi:hypothetical protein
MLTRLFNKYNPALLLILSSLATGCMKKFDPNDYKPEKSYGGYTASNQIAPQNLVGYWAFDGSLTDSISGSSGQAFGTGFTQGLKGQALQGADNGYVLTTPSTDIQNLESFTVSLWVNTAVNTDGAVGLVTLVNSTSFWANIDVFLENGATAQVGAFKGHLINNGSDMWLGTYSVPNVFNAWTNIILTYNAKNSTAEFFVNGSSLGKATQATNGGPLHFTDASALVFGTMQFMTDPSLTSAADAQDWAGYLTGALDEVRIYNKALSTSDVVALYSLEKLGR